MVTRVIRAARVASRNSRKAERQAPWREQQRGLQPAEWGGKPVMKQPMLAPGVPVPEPYKRALPA